MRFDPTDDLEFILRGDYSDNRSDGLVENLGGLVPVFGPGGVPTFSSMLLNVGVGKGFISLADLAQLGTSATAAGRVIGGMESTYNFLLPYVNQGYNSNYAGPTSARARTAGGSLTATYQINDDLSVKSITAYRYQGQWSNQDAVPSPVLTLYGVGDEIGRAHV